MTVVPVLAVGMALNFQFKIVFELGEKVTGVSVASNLCMYVNAAMKLFCAIYFIFLAETDSASCLSAENTFLTAEYRFC